MNKVIALLLLLLTTLFAQKEAGDYDRPSITYIPYLFDVDGTVSNLNSIYQNGIIHQIGKQLQLPRYDYNNLSDSLFKEFKKSVTATEISCLGNRDYCFEEASQLINREMTPAIIKVIKNYQDKRAIDRMSEQQKNSFITDKAKELGYTEEEVRRAINSAYIFLPFASNFSIRTWLDTIIVTKTVYSNGVPTTRTERKIVTYFSPKIVTGVTWWKVVLDSTTNRIRLQGYKPLLDTVTSVAQLGKTYKIGNRTYRAKEYAYTMLGKNSGAGYRNLLKAFDEFALSGQVLSKRAGFVNIDIGAYEGIKVDDIFWLKEKIEENGKDTIKNSGWIMIRDVADSSSKNGYISKGQIIGGRSYIGEVIKEQPTWDVEARLSFTKMVIQSKQDSATSHIEGLNIRDLRISDGYGAKLQLMMPLGRWAGISQLYFNVNGAVGGTNVDGTIGYTEFKDTTLWDTTDNGGLIPKDTIIEKNYPYHYLNSAILIHIDASILKRFYVKRVAVSLETGGGYSMTNYVMTDDTNYTNSDYDYQLSADRWGGYSDVGLEVAISPSVAVGGTFGYSYYGKTDAFDYEQKLKDDDDAKWESAGDFVAPPTVHYNGVIWSAYFTFRPLIKFRDSKK